MKSYLGLIIILMFCSKINANDILLSPKDENKKFGISLSSLMFNPPLLNFESRNYFEYTNSLYARLDVIKNRFEINAQIYSKTYRFNGDTINGYILNKDEIFLYSGYNLGFGYEFIVLNDFTILPRASFGFMKMEVDELNSEAKEEQLRAFFDYSFGLIFRAKILELNDWDVQDKERFLIELESSLLYFPMSHKNTFNYSSNNLSVLFGFSVKYIFSQN